MLTILPLPDDPDAAAKLLTDQLHEARLASGGALVRDEALAIFRRHLTRIQHHVRERFEHYQRTGLQSARSLAALTDGLISALY